MEKRELVFYLLFLAFDWCGCAVGSGRLNQAWHHCSLFSPLRKKCILKRFLILTKGYLLSLLFLLFRSSSALATRSSSSFLLLLSSSSLLFRLSSSLSPTENIRHEHKREGEETSFDEKGRVLTWITLEFRNRGKLAREEICKLRTQLRRLRQFPGCRLCRICFSRFQHLWTGSRWRRICLSS